MATFSRSVALFCYYRNLEDLRTYSGLQTQPSLKKTSIQKPKTQPSMAQRKHGTSRTNIINTKHYQRNRRNGDVKELKTLLVRGYDIWYANMILCPVMAYISTTYDTFPAHSAGVDAGVNLPAMLGLCLDGTRPHRFRTSIIHRISRHITEGPNSAQYGQYQP